MINLKICLCALLAYCIYTDETKGKIKNHVLFLFLFFEIFITMYLNFSLKFMLAGFFIPLFLLFIPFVLKGVGAGDVKLFMIIGSIVGSKKILIIMLITFLIVLFEALIKKILRKDFKYIHMALPIGISSMLWIGGFI